MKKNANFGPQISQAERCISTSVIQSYSRCHAQGFLQHRLSIQTHKKSSYGVDSVDVGILVHDLLATFDDISSEKLPEKSDCEKKSTPYSDKHPVIDISPLYKKTPYPSMF